MQDDDICLTSVATFDRLAERYAEKYFHLCTEADTGLGAHRAACLLMSSRNPLARTARRLAKSAA
jgi:hypothetical protein